MITPSFVHPASLRRDKRMRRLRATHGWLGYGLCLAIMEMLLDEPDQTLEPQYDLLASELGAPGELIRSLVEDFDLFVFDQPGGIRQFRSLPLPASVAPSPRPDEPQEPSCPSARATAGSGAPRTRPKAQLSEAQREQRRRAAQKRWQAQPSAQAQSQPLSTPVPPTEPVRPTEHTNNAEPTEPTNNAETEGGGDIIKEGEYPSLDMQAPRDVEGVQGESGSSAPHPPGKRRRERRPEPFVKPTQAQVLEYMLAKMPDRSSAERLASKYWHYYESNGWRVGKNKMRSWQSAACNWLVDRHGYNATSQMGAPYPREGTGPVRPIKHHINEAAQEQRHLLPPEVLGEYPDGTPYYDEHGHVLPPAP